ncbi:CPBP family intramembrane glutamic endopeptidase [Flavobacterium oreochromis]|uniref:CPBP family intramembrane glutamic endopeptidase n=1 Tax=Flavobacterium oreochromis TaxID=2906078 RepID=UPI000CDB8507|nr:CPBP family intramembrane glutamic endopeptidase [Flavobacterium oreochromis]POR19127.1 abortive infection protein [Flavobacterium columnare]QYS87737.1 CPBP family intramembrane metalloprotease [Flavobacterium oreochromis]
MKNKINYLAIIIFYVVAVICRYLTNKAGVLDGIGNEYLKSILTGIGPALGALAVFMIFKIKPTMNLKGNYKSLVLPLMIYWVLPIVLISSVTYFSKGTIPWLVILSILVYGLFEEIGWRGFLYQNLKGLPLFANILIVSSLWFLWHLNFELTSSNLLFFGILILGSWGIGKVADSTNSLIAVSGFHSLNNFFPELDSTKILILVILLTIWILGLVLRKRFQKNIG